MAAILKNAHVFNGEAFHITDLTVDGLSTCREISNVYVFPGLVDVHVHFREPGFSYKETIKTGSMAAAHGGYTAVCPMPNLDPAPDSAEHLRVQTDIIERDACIRVIPYGTITIGEKGKTLADMEAMADNVIAFSDDGHGVQNDDMMRSAMYKAKALGKLICAHCEDNSLLNGGYIHAGSYAAAHGHRGISSESEWRQIERDLALVRETGCGYHVCHISTKESVALIREAKREGLNVSCETGPHYLILTEDDLIEDGRFKMNPPLRTRADRDALIEGIIDGTIDMIATDHAPHSAEEKSRGLEKSAMGVVGLETAFAECYTHLVKTNIISLEQLIRLMSINPSKRFNIPIDPTKDMTVFDLNARYTIEPESFLSKGRATPFAGDTVYGKCLLTLCGGKTAYRSDDI